MFIGFGKKFSTGVRERELGNDVELLQFQSESEGLFAKRSDVVLVRSTDPADEAVNPQALQKPGDLAGGFAQKMATEILTLKAADVELAAEERFK